MKNIVKGVKYYLLGISILLSAIVMAVVGLSMGAFIAMVIGFLFCLFGFWWVTD